MSDYNSFGMTLIPLPKRLSALGERSRKLRLLRNLTQKELSVHSGIGVATLHRFEKTGHISLENALRIAMALGADDLFDRFFELPKYESFDEAFGRTKKVERKRVRKRK